MSSTRKKAIVLSCGTYNPPTYMHLRMFEVAKDYLKKRLQYDEVEGIMSPVHDSYRQMTVKTISDSVHRCNMVKLALKGSGIVKHNWIRIDEWESKQEKWTRTVDVLKHHYDEIGKQKIHKRDGTTCGSSCGSSTGEPDPKAPAPRCHLMLLCGADMFDSFSTPGLWNDEDIETILGNYGVLVLPREGYDPLSTIHKSAKSSLLVKFKDNVHVIDDRIKNNVSSTFIRNAVNRGDSVRYLTDDSVIDYIQKFGLYKTQIKSSSSSSSSEGKEEKITPKDSGNPKDSAKDRPKEQTK